MASRTLNYQQRLFLINYVGRCAGNGEEAARLAGYRNPPQDAARLLQHPIVCAAIEAKLEEAAMTADEVMARISDIASADFDDFLDEYEEQVGVDEIGNPKYERKVAFNYQKAKKRKKTHLISSFEIEPNGKVKVKLHSAADALDKLARVHGLYKDKLDIRAQIGDSDEDRRRFVTVFGALAHLEGAGGGREGWGEGESGSFRGGSLEGEVAPGSAPATLELPPPDGGEEADHPPDDHPGSEAWEI